MRSSDNLSMGNLLLAERYLPPVKSGKITIHANQQLSSPDKAESQILKQAALKEAQLVVTCEAADLTLGKEEVYSAYPPENAFGSFETVLPHMVLCRKTLPWERSMEIKDAPWLALLLFSEEEDAVLESMDVSEAFTQRPDTYCPVKMRGEYEPGTSCLVLDAAADLFCAVCPDAGELALLAHVCCVNRDNKAAGNDYQEEWLSVLTGSRLPCSGGGERGLCNTIYMVSLEDFGQFLMDADLRRQIASKTKWKRVRIPVLAASSFYSKKEDYSFAKFFRALTADTLRVQNREAGAEEALPLLQRGYSAHNHMLRDGSRTVSLYHGPLLPWDAVCPKPKYEIFTDARLIYQPELGMFDVSEAAAANLGKMLALQDSTFANALMQFRKNNELKAEECFYQKYQLTSVYGIRKRRHQGGALHQILDQEMTELLSELLKRQRTELLTGEGEEKLFSGRREKGADLRQVCVEKASLFEAGEYCDCLSENEEIPKAVTDFLADLSLLYRVPFAYLVPDEQMLPEDSIRFFRVDFHWLYALLDGAMSLGRNFQENYEQDTVLIEQILSEIYEKRCAVRPRLLRKSPDAQKRYVKRCFLAADDKKTGQVNTGFLMRSELVKSFQGIEFAAYAQKGDKEPLPCLRLEVIGKEILIGIYAGECNYLEIRQPPEGMHFGMVDAGGSYEKLLRDLDTGELFTDKPENRVKIAIRDRQRGVINIVETAENIRKTLALSKVTSAHLALQLIQNPFTGTVEGKK